MKKYIMVFVIAFRERRVIMADGTGTGGQDPRNDPGQNNTYHYNYSYGSGRGTAPSGGYKPPRNSSDWGEWVGIGFLLFVLPFPFKLFGVFWLLSKLGKMTASDKRRYKQEARNAANRARNTAENLSGRPPTRPSGGRTPPGRLRIPPGRPRPSPAAEAPTATSMASPGRKKRSRSSPGSARTRPRAGTSRRAGGKRPGKRPEAAPGSLSRAAYSPEFSAWAPWPA